MFTYPFSFHGPKDNSDLDAQAFIARTTGLNPAVEDAINTLILSLKSDNLWNKIDFLNLIMPSDSVANGRANSLLNIRQDLWNGTEQGTLTFNNSLGFSGWTTANFITNGYKMNATPVNEVARPDDMHNMAYLTGSYGTVFQNWECCGFLKAGTDGCSVLIKWLANPLYWLTGYPGGGGFVYLEWWYYFRYLGLKATTMLPALGPDPRTGYAGYDRATGQSTKACDNFDPTKTEYDNVEYIVGGYNTVEYPGTPVPARPLWSGNCIPNIMGWGFGSGFTLTEFQNYMTHIQAYMTTLNIEV